jgi:hypothetical protein
LIIPNQVKWFWWLNKWFWWFWWCSCNCRHQAVSTLSLSLSTLSKEISTLSKEISELSIGLSEKFCIGHSPVVAGNL